ncbi:uncharacterized protein LOC661523 isoform X2 [Tribolium castaneum]|uniref:RETREG1-3/ARL6IP-like N-terminal reticulon-homology domain-containing protein n=1 Tax=Tribolium castaneum TaxID=7070 RepID=D6X1A9_TRICA|nr:PREDICTED: uncharacterized protein LOC661523 isoform X2 [Tribolium castaneum]XP_015839250.1 PREDICTED: uncharacterized protein LOC661523 isoform X2 [Tribolium castaneum]EFA09515.1 hypothetical protein TcasGA2_TC011617 [Tribolium castaneum]|eukprot:XP_008198506.1 PREDICTED: uncharacterized protein LOC661523 isoform X2 [Tribolium castaneum]
MDFLTRKVRSFFISEEKSVKRREITRIDGYFELVYKILCWEDVSLTLSVFLVLNFLFWLVVQLQLRTFGVVFLLALVAFIGDAYFENGGALEVQSAHLEALDELKNDLMDVVFSLKALRKDSPSSFCIAMSFVFLMISFIAKNISGYVICYLMLLGVFFVPLGLSKLPPEYVNSVKQFIKTVGSDRGVLAEDELIPFISDKDFGQRDPDLDSLLTDKTADSVTNSLISGLASMPSHLDGEDKESLAEEDLLPGGRSPGDTSSDSDSEHRGIRFESRHFNGDSSEEEHFSRNLSFDKTARKDSSSDSDFEIINTEEAEEQ